MKPKEILASYQCPTTNCPCISVRGGTCIDGVRTWSTALTSCPPCRWSFSPLDQTLLPKSPVQTRLQVWCTEEGSKGKQQKVTARMSTVYVCTYSCTIRAFVRLFIRSFIHSSIHSLMHSFIHLFIHLLLQSFINSLIYYFMHSFIHAFIHAFTYSACCVH